MSNNEDFNEIEGMEGSTPSSSPMDKIKSGKDRVAKFQDKTGEGKNSSGAIGNASNIANDVQKNGGIQGAIAKKAMDKTIGENPATKAIDEQKEKALNAAKSVQKMTKTIEGGFKGIVLMLSQLGNPFFWAALMAVVLVAATFSAVQVIGQNENACLSAPADSDSGADLNIQSSKDAMKNANIIGTWLMKTKFKFNDNKPFTKEQMAGVMGNMQQESGWMPATSQGHRYDKISNDAALAMGKGRSGNAFGLIQWDASNRYELVQYAKSKNKPWQDLGVQLDFWKQWWEKDSYESSMAKKALDTSDKTVKGYALAWNDNVERSASANHHSDKDALVRVKNAEAFIKVFKPTEDIPDSGGDDGGGAGTAACDAAETVDNSSIVNFAIGIAWPRGHEKDAADKKDGTHGKSSATPAYIDAKKKAEDASDKDPMDLFSDCGRFVATVMKNTVDKNFPWGPTGDQIKYLDGNSDKYEKVGQSKSQLQPGDILITDGGGSVGHVAIYGGEIDGKETVIDASMEQRTGLVHDFWFTDNLTDKVGGTTRQYTIYRSKIGGTGGSSGTKVTCSQNSTVGLPQGAVAFPGHCWFGGKGVDVKANGGDESEANPWQCAELARRLWESQGWAPKGFSTHRVAAGKDMWKNNWGEPHLPGISEPQGQITQLSAGDWVSMDVVTPSGSHTALGHIGVVNSISGNDLEMVNQNAPTIVWKFTYDGHSIHYAGGGTYQFNPVGVLHHQ